MESNLRNEIAVESVRIRTKDGFELGGMLYRPETDVSAERAVLFNTGGGVAAHRYRKLAAFLARSGIPSLLYDYRGIGASRPASLRGFHASLEDWTEYDCAGAIDWLQNRYPATSLIGVGHSIGNLIFGGATNTRLLSHLIMICPHTGYVGDYRVAYWVPMAALWHGVMPFLTNVFGYFPASRLGLGDDIPRAIALQWARQLRPGLRPYRKNSESRVTELLQRCRSLRKTATLVTVTDDAFATHRGAKRLISYFPKLAIDHQFISPSLVGMRRIGHFGMFRQSAVTSLWPQLLALIMRVPPQPTAATFSGSFDSEGCRSAPSRPDLDGGALANQGTHVSVR